MKDVVYCASHAFTTVEWAIVLTVFTIAAVLGAFVYADYRATCFLEEQASKCDWDLND